jgi:hypothetical protein
MFVSMPATHAAKQTHPAEMSASFKEHKGHYYRMVDKNAYLVLDTASFYLYKYNKLVQGEKIARPQDVFYFSVRPDGPLQELTRANLERAFSNNRAFLYRLYTDFSSDKDLVTYIPSLKTYKIKFAYGQSLQ